VVSVSENILGGYDGNEEMQRDSRNQKFSSFSNCVNTSPENLLLRMLLRGFKSLKMETQKGSCPNGAEAQRKLIAPWL